MALAWPAGDYAKANKSSQCQVADVALTSKETLSQKNQWPVYIVLPRLIIALRTISAARFPWNHPVSLSSFLSEEGFLSSEIPRATLMSGSSVFQVPMWGFPSRFRQLLWALSPSTPAFRIQNCVTFTGSLRLTGLDLWRKYSIVLHVESLTAAMDQSSTAWWCSVWGCSDWVPSPLSSSHGICFWIQPVLHLFRPVIFLLLATVIDWLSTLINQHPQQPSVEWNEVLLKWSILCWTYRCSTAVLVRIASELCASKIIIRLPSWKPTAGRYQKDIPSVETGHPTTGRVNVNF